MGIDAVRNAFMGIFEEGNHGAGTGASVGKMMGMDRAMKTGLGTFACGDECVQVGAIAAVNACADVYSGAGNIIAGLRTKDGSEIQGTVRVLKGMIHSESDPELSFSDIKAMAAEEAAKKSSAEETGTGNEKEDIARALMASYQMEQEQSQTELSVSADEEQEPQEDNAEISSGEIPAEPQIEDVYLDMDAEPEPISDPEPAPEPEAETVTEPEPELEYVDPEPAEQEDDGYVLTEEDKNDMGYDIAFNTTISCVITNAIITKSQANKLASILHDAYARAIKPVHSTLDGDTVFVMSTCTQEVNFDAFAALATDVLQYAIIDGAHSAYSAYGLPASRDIIRK